MSRENVQVVRKWVASWVEGDTRSAAEMFHQDCEILLPRNLLEGGSYRGPEGVRRAFADLAESWDRVEWRIEQFRDFGDRVVALGHTLNVPPTGPPIEYTSAYLFKVRDGKISYLRPFQSHEEALEAAGLSEHDVRS
jgi:ketosteroid isomerase-like protein